MRRFCVLLTALLMAGCPAKKPAAPQAAPSPAPTETPEASPSATPMANPSPTPETTPSASPSPAPEASAKPESSASPETPSAIAPQPDQPVTTMPTVPAPVPTPEPSATASPASSAAPSPTPLAKAAHGPVEGTWAVIDEQGDLFDIVLFPNGQAVTNWTKGPDKARGQHGKWVKKETGAVITYNSLDSDVIEKTADGYQMKRLSGHTTVNLNMAQPLAMKRVEGTMARYVGVWKMNQEPDGSYLMIALQSNGTAVSTVNGGTVGKWEGGHKSAICTWPDGWFDEIEYNGKAWQRRSWVGAEANGDADKSEAERVGEGSGS